MYSLRPLPCLLWHHFPWSCSPPKPNCFLSIPAFLWPSLCSPSPGTALPAPSHPLHSQLKVQLRCFFLKHPVCDLLWLGTVCLPLICCGQWSSNVSTIAPLLTIPKVTSFPVHGLHRARDFFFDICFTLQVDKKLYPMPQWIHACFDIKIMLFSKIMR